MSAAEATAFPWAIFISGAVGVAGIAGTLLSGHFANGAAEKRRLAEQQNNSTMIAPDFTKNVSRSTRDI
jgi:hypothetical protein